MEKQMEDQDSFDEPQSPHVDKTKADAVVKEDDPLTKVNEKYNFTSQVFVGAFTLNIVLGVWFQIFLYTDPPKSQLGFSRELSEENKVICILFPCVLLVCSAFSSVYARLDQDKGWLLAAIFFQTAFACSCHIMYDDTEYIVFALFTSASSFVVVCCLLRFDQLLDEAAKLGQDRRSQKQVSFYDLPDLGVEESMILTYITSAAVAILFAGWAYVLGLIYDFMSHENLVDTSREVISITCMIVCLVIAGTAVYGTVMKLRTWIMFSASLSLVLYSTIAVFSTTTQNAGQYHRNACDMLNQKSDALPAWTEWGNYYLNWPWEELDVTVSQTVTTYTQYAASQGRSSDLRFIEIMDGTGEECDKIENTQAWLTAMIYLTLFFPLLHTWCCFRLSEKLQKNGTPVSSFLGLDLVKDLDSYMDPIQFLLFGCAVGILALYGVLAGTYDEDLYTQSACYDPPVPIPQSKLTQGAAAYCPALLAQNRCGDLTNVNLCPASCTPCPYSHYIITDPQLVGQHVVPGCLLVLVGILNYINAREGVEFDKEWSNAIWFLSVWGIGTMFFFGLTNYIQGTETDWWGTSEMTFLGPYWQNIYQTIGLLKIFGGFALVANITFANMYSEALEDEMEAVDPEKKRSPQQLMDADSDGIQMAGMMKDSEQKRSQLQETEMSQITE